MITECVKFTICVHDETQETIEQVKQQVFNLLYELCKNDPTMEGSPLPKDCDHID